MNIAVGLVERRAKIPVELMGAFLDDSGRRHPAGRQEITAPITLRPEDPKTASFAIEDVTIGIGFHWERQERQAFRGTLRVAFDGGLVAINDVPVDDYVASRLLRDERVLPARAAEGACRDLAELAVAPAQPPEAGDRGTRRPAPPARSSAGTGVRRTGSSTSARTITASATRGSPKRSRPPPPRPPPRRPARR